MTARPTVRRRTGRSTSRQNNTQVNRVRKVVRKRYTNKPNFFGRMISSLGRLFLAISMVLFVILSVFLVMLWLYKPTMAHKNIVFVNASNTDSEGKIVFAEIYPESQQIRISVLDKNIENEVMGGYGMYKLSSLLGLLKLEKKDDQYIKAAYGHFLQKGVDEVIVADVGNIAGKYDLLKLLLSHRQSLATAFYVKELGDDQIKINQFSDLTAWHRSSNSGVKPKLNDDCSVAVINTTGLAGLAGEVSAVLENSGLEVVRTTNNLSGENQTGLIVDDAKKCSQVLSRVKSISPIELEIKTDAAQTGQYRANVVLLIGDQFVE